MKIINSKAEDALLTLGQRVSAAKVLVAHGYDKAMIREIQHMRRILAKLHGELEQSGSSKKRLQDSLKECNINPDASVRFSKADPDMIEIHGTFSISQMAGKMVW